MTNATAHQFDALQDRFGLKVAARLNENAGHLPHDISERLRVARQQAVAKRKKQTQLQTAPSVWSAGGAAVLGGGDWGGANGLGLWSRIASVLPLVALVAGLVAINVVQNDQRANEVAEVDTLLLTDELPPAAYADPGFTQFLKSGRPGL